MGAQQESLPVVRVLEFGVAGGDQNVDSLIDDLVETVAAAGGLERVIAARRDDIAGSRALLITIWQDDVSMKAAVLTGTTPAYQPGLAPYLASATVTVFDARGSRWDVAPGAIQAISVERHAGTAADAPPEARSDSGPTLTLRGSSDGDWIEVMAVAERGREAPVALFGSPQNVTAGLPGNTFHVTHDVVVASLA